MSARMSVPGFPDVTIEAYRTTQWVPGKGADLQLAQVFLAAAGAQHRARAVGRRQREVRWIVNGNLIAPDWAGVQSSARRRDCG